MVGLVVLVTYVVLFLLLGSILLPLKAVVMNVLSITASFGALVWIFQDGRLARLFASTAFFPSGSGVASGERAGSNLV